MKIVTLILVLAACARADDGSSDSSSESSRQKRLLFFDEGGSLVKTYPNPYMNQLSENGQNLPFYGNFLNPFFNFIRHFGSSLIAYTIPVSNAIIQSIKQDPIKNTLVLIPKKDPVVAPNILCQGKRTQIPAPNLCNNFLNCWDGWAFEQECPTGLLFSSHGYCDYADNVDCHNRKLDAEIPEPQPVCSKDFEAFRNQLNCNEFFICVNRQPVRFKCPADLAYSPILGVCDYADRVDCTSTGSSVALAPQPAYPTPAPSPVLPPSPVNTPIQQETPEIPPSLPEITPALPEIPPASSVIPPASPVIPPASPVIPPASPVIPPVSPVIPPSSPVIPPQSPPPSPTIPPAPAAIPPLPSLLPPGSVFPSIIPRPVYPSQRPVPPADVFPAFIPEGLQKPGDKPGFPDNGFANPGCSSANVAMSRQDAIRLLQKAIANNISY